MSARHYPYTGGDPGSPYFDAVPTWLNDLLLEQTPGREMRNFRLAVRRAWMEDCCRRHPIALAVVHRNVRDATGAAFAVVVECLRRWQEVEDAKQA